MIQSEVLLSLVIGSDVDLSDIGSRLTRCVANHACLHCQGLFTEVLSIYISDNIGGKRHASSQARDVQSALSFINSLLKLLYDRNLGG